MRIIATRRKLAGDLHDYLAQMRVAVADKGNGLTTDALQRSAEPGHLGLVSVRERFNAMGGRVDVESLPEQGTTVTLVLPLDSRWRRDVSRETGGSHEKSATG